MADDDLRFGDVSDGGDGGGGGGVVELFTQLFMAVIFFYVLLKIIEILFEISIPFV